MIPKGPRLRSPLQVVRDPAHLRDPIEDEVNRAIAAGRAMAERTLATAQQVEGAASAAGRPSVLAGRKPGSGRGYRLERIKALQQQMDEELAQLGHGGSKQRKKVQGIRAVEAPAGKASGS